MANATVLALAGQFQVPSLTVVQQKRLLASMLLTAILANNADPTVANWKTYISGAESVFKGIPTPSLTAVRAAIYNQILIDNTSLAPSAADGASLSTKLQATGYLEGLAEDQLDRLIQFLEGVTAVQLTL